MEYLIFGLVIMVIAAMIVLRANNNRLRKKREKIQNAWGKPKKDLFSFDLIQRYANQSNEKVFHRLNDQTIGDIDLHQLFEFIDRTTSRVGQQYLYKKLVEPSDQVRDPSQPLIEIFTTDKQLREEVQMELLKLNHTDAYYISSLFQKPFIEKPVWFKWLFLNVAVVLGLLLLSFKFPVLTLALIVPAAVNIHIHYWNRSKIFSFVRAFPQLNLLIQVSKAISARNTQLHDPKVNQSISDLNVFRQRTLLINLNQTNSVADELGQLAGYLLELIKGFFLIEVFTFYGILRDLEGKRNSMRTLFDYVGRLDVCLSVASLRNGAFKTTQPILTPDKKEVKAKCIYHPLVHEGVANDLVICQKGVLITGSNMSGKTTFLRAFIINSILAQTIYTCFADEFVSPIVRQFSSIRLGDDLAQGKSYYFAEVDLIGKFLAESEFSPCLFVLDEVFKGTNTIERIAAAKAVLSYLNRNSNIVMVATHDLELAELLDAEFDLHHFSEDINHQALHFDYKLKPGKIRTRNAIRLLEVANYPKAIIDEAQRLSSGDVK